MCESDGQCVLAPTGCQFDSQESCNIQRSLSEKVWASYYAQSDKSNASNRADTNQRCLVDSGHSSGAGNIVLGKELTVRYFASSLNHMTACVSWTFTNSSGKSGVIEVDLLKWDRRTLYRYCIQDLTRRQLCIHNLEYRHLKSWKYFVRVLPHPMANPASTIQSSSRSVQLKTNISGCADIPKLPGTTCGLKRYQPPSNITVRTCLNTNGSKNLAIAWDPPRESAQLPQSYILYIGKGLNKFTYFHVRNASQVTLRNMDSSLNYTIEIAAYRKCAGKGSSDLDHLGCGKTSQIMREAISRKCSNLDKYTTTYTHPDTPLSDQFQLSFTPGAVAVVTEDTYLQVVLGVTGAIILTTLAVTAMLCAAVHLFRHFSHTSLIKTSVHPQSVNSSPKIFVFYSPSTCDSRLKSVQERVVCLLTEYFEVVTLNDISSGNMSLWLEETVKSAHSVLMVANKEFCCDWNRSKEDRLPLMNLLELHISSAAAQNSLGKFAFVCAEDSLQDVFVPSHSYLKLMPVFLLGRKNCDLDRLYQFVTKSRGIELDT